MRELMFWGAGRRSSCELSAAEALVDVLRHCIHCVEVVDAHMQDDLAGCAKACAAQEPVCVDCVD